jgi:ribonuclease HII
MSKADRCFDLYKHDLALWESGLVFAGIDEAGRGPLAGCVMAGCVVMPREPRLPDILDSKQLTPKQREAAYDQIVQKAVFWGLGSADQNEIDTMNILEATRLAMRRAAQQARVDLFLVDAVKHVGLAGEERALVSGDAISYSIAAASILAKVTRDRLMMELDKQYPQYGFARHKGYGTREHIQAIRTYGPCPAHRMSFLTRLLHK